MKQTLEGRVVGILIADGSDAGAVEAVVAAVTKAKAKAVIVAPKVGGAKLSDGNVRKADGQLAGSPSQIFDAVAIVLSEQGCAALLKEAAAVQFAMDAFGHLKAIGASDAAKPLLDKAGVVPDDGVTGLGKDFIAAAAKRFYDREPGIRTLA
jgi:catalase